MAGFLREVRRTLPLKHAFFVRYAAGAPLGVFGIMHLTMDDVSLRPVLTAAGLPLAGFNSLFVPIVEIIVAFLLATGFHARPAAAIGGIVMAVALYAHGVADWPGEMTPLVPLGVLLCCMYTLWRGAGAWSADLAMWERAPEGEGPVRTLRAADVEEHREARDRGRSAHA
jgi:uncharacterized membrane protein YphA (DoxX/SURF4 family)